MINRPSCPFSFFRSTRRRKGGTIQSLSSLISLGETGGFMVDISGVIHKSDQKLDTYYRNIYWLVVSTNPSEKWWSESQLGLLFPIYGKIIQSCSKPPSSIKTDQNDDVLRKLRSLETKLPCPQEGFGKGLLDDSLCPGTTGNHKHLELEQQAQVWVKTLKTLYLCSSDHSWYSWHSW